MSTEKDKEFDDFFKKGLEDPIDHTGYEEKDWDSMEQMLDKNKKRKGIVYWLPVLSAVAALLLLFLGWWAFQSNGIQHSGKRPHSQTLVKNEISHGKSNTSTTGGAIKPTTDNKTTTNNTTADNQTTNNKHTIPLTSGYANASNTRNNGKISTNGRSNFTLPSNGSGLGITGPGKKGMSEAQSFETLTAMNSVQFFGSASITTPSIHSFEIKSQAFNQSTNHSESKSKITQRSAFRPQYALSVLAAPDLNGVGSFQQSKVGTNVGLLFSAGLVKKLTVSTGVLYSAKPYTMAFENYQTQYHFSVNPVNVTANCQMLDIPLNVGYQLYNKRNNQISIGTGLSSYIMLHENYKFNYADPYATGPSSYNVPNSGKYFFGVLNLNATYQRQLNSKVGLSIQPYLKLPLTNLGYSQVRLQTTGVAVGLNWNLNSSKR